MSGALTASIGPGASSAMFGLSGQLTKDSSSSPVVSDAVTVVGSGTFLFDTVATDGSAPQYNYDSGGFANITEGMTLAVTAGKTLIVRCTLGTVGFDATFNLKNNTGGALIEAVTLTRIA